MASKNSLFLETCMQNMPDYEEYYEKYKHSVAEIHRYFFGCVLLVFLLNSLKNTVRSSRISMYIVP